MVVFLGQGSGGTESSREVATSTACFLHFFLLPLEVATHKMADSLGSSSFLGFSMSLSLSGPMSRFSTNRKEVGTQGSYTGRRLDLGNNMQAEMQSTIWRVTLP